MEPLLSLGIGYNCAQVIHAVAIMHSSLEFPAETPQGYQNLSQRCMAADPELRPSFPEICHALHSLQAFEATT